MTLRLWLSSVKTWMFRRPVDEAKRLYRWGPRAYFRFDAWASQMEQAAYNLPPLAHSEENPASPLVVWYLTGSRFWYQTAFCAWTLSYHSHRRIVLNLIDDGSLQAHQERQLRNLFPEGITRWKHDLAQTLEEKLPIARFPHLRERWLDYVNIRKLTDIHLGSRGLKLVLDSDMLFFSCPHELLAWWDNPKGPCLMTDFVESYGYSRQLMEDLSGASIPPLLNVGICGLRSEDLDWQELEHWCGTLVEQEGARYFLEQALVAMLAARTPPMVMPPSSYITLPNRKQILAGEGVLQHYVAESKPWYFRNAWRKALTLCHE